MIYTPLTRKAAQIAYEAHAGQVDKAGWPYIHHPLHVAEQVESEYEVCAALLHDVCEDTEWTLDGLREQGFPAEVIDALALLTHDKAVPYMDYVARVKANPIAVAVKMADLRHNADLTRLDAPTEKDQERAEKYRQAYKMLTGEEMK